jgi:hypothetical protein
VDKEVVVDDDVDDPTDVVVDVPAVEAALVAPVVVVAAPEGAGKEYAPFVGDWVAPTVR